MPCNNPLPSHTKPMQTKGPENTIYRSNQNVTFNGCKNN